MKDRLISGTQKAILALLLVLTYSCVPVSKLKYLNDIDELQAPIVNPKEQKLIMPFNTINIKVISIDEKTNQLFNADANTEIGYPVDADGNINYPFVGKINVNGLTPEQAGLKLSKALSQYVSDASVSVNFINNSVTVIGQVQSQGVFSFTQDKLNIYEALALGGGISQYGDRKNVILIRQDGGKIMHHKLDLSDSRIAGKEYYYIESNDVIVVEPLKSAAWYNFNSTNFTTIMSSLTTFLVIYTIFFPTVR